MTFKLPLVRGKALIVSLSKKTPSFNSSSYDYFNSHRPHPQKPLNLIKKKIAITIFIIKLQNVDKSKKSC
jgi:hypothetical protein